MRANASAHLHGAGYCDIVTATVLAPAIRLSDRRGEIDDYVFRL
jgi:hypothetical protein